MVKKLLFKKIGLRFAIFCLLTAVSYLLSITYLFAFHDIFGSLISVFATFIFFHFLFIDIKYIKFSYFIILLLSLILIEISCIFIFGWTFNIWIFLSIIAYNGAFGALFFSLGFVDFSSISYFTRGGFIFTVFITIMYSVAFAGMFQHFPFTCEGLRDASSKLYNFVEKPFMLTFSKSDNDIDDSDMKEKNFDINEFVYDINNIEIVSNDDNNFSPYISTFYEIKDNVFKQVLNDQSDYSDGVCDLLLNKINSIFNLDNFKWSVILLSYLLLYGFVRIAFLFMSTIAFILFKILYLLKVYRIKKSNRTVDEII